MNQTVLHAGTPIKIAILAMGGQGGGVLADWIIEMAEHGGWWAQTTSVPGVAQRTGATIYYLELLPESAAAAAGRPPVLAMMPTPGDIDLVVAAELMEAGRAMQRGLVTPERSTLITSTHRSYSVTEKAALGNGIGDPNKVLDAGREAARRMIAIDLQALAEQAGSVISASLFGAIAGSGALPFGREAFESTIRASGKGVEPSLRAFALGFDAAAQAPATPAAIDTRHPAVTVPERAEHPDVQRLLRKIKTEFPPVAHGMLVAGVRRLIDYQDVAYAGEYLQTCAEIRVLDERHGGTMKGWALTQAAAHRLAVAMSYDDVIRVADLKTRGSRFERVRNEVGAKADQLVYTTEFMHPRLEEICGTLPAGLGRWLENSKGIGAFVKRKMEHGRRVQTGTLTWFLALHLVAGMRRFRRGLLRHRIETAQQREWLNRVVRLVAHGANEGDYELAVEVLHCRRIVKGYSGTHDRGDKRFAVLMKAADKLAGRPGAAMTLHGLLEAAMADEAGKRLDEELARCIQASRSEGAIPDLARAADRSASPSVGPGPWTIGRVDLSDPLRPPAIVGERSRSPTSALMRERGDLIG
ncbi:indolepyruvate oxidoreductase subunit beta family protein [Azoarcus sp. KH32C]|uniref:indolepyruvate oxidoreductase subunit beta family protein n=1 Tax=Azoarcus sp. KH32C TaxID=748247 RepID=UPI00023865FB|nr:indolepyruvate oxidoreductase subunit beta family protein [Azoarcus sp. KH32C]BAL24186.1 indolepyruvate ferredoxin oxidoreductase, beta subunit [Azoarcus sp. KH32C]